MSILDTYFDKIFVINLDSRKDRWEECQELFKKYNINNYERVSAVRPIYKDIPKNFYNNLVVNQKEWYVTGCIGCKLSHYKVIQLAKERGYDNFLVLEEPILFILRVKSFNPKYLYKLYARAITSASCSGNLEPKDSTPN